MCCSSIGCCSSTCSCCCWCCCGRCSSTRRWWPTGSHPTESLVEQDCVSSGYRLLCVSWAESSCPTESRREKKTTKNQQITLKIHVNVVCTCTLLYRTTHGPTHGPVSQIHGPAHVIVGPARIEPVFHRPRCRVMGRAGPGRDVCKNDGPGGAVAHPLKN